VSGTWGAVVGNILMVSAQPLDRLNRDHQDHRLLSRCPLKHRLSFSGMGIAVTVVRPTLVALVSRPAARGVGAMKGDRH
jgi:hypothetical protein